MEQREQLRGDAVNGAGENADDGVQKPANDGCAHENTSLSVAAEWGNVRAASRTNLQEQSKTSKQLLELLVWTDGRPHLGIKNASVRLDSTSRPQQAT